MRADLPTVQVLGVPVAQLDAEAALTEVVRLYEARAPALLAYVNAHTLNIAWTNETYRALLRDADLVLNDGAGLALAGRLKRRPFPANLNGSDFNPRIVELAARRGWPVFFLGARPGVAAAAAARLAERLPTLRVAGARDGYFERSESRSVAEEVRAAGTGLLMVAMGNPLQELWLGEHLAVTGARLGVGVGAFFDFTAGRARRAPGWMNRAGIEWVWRLAHEPRRMWRRYIVGNPLFLARVVAESRRGDRS